MDVKNLCNFLCTIFYHKISSKMPNYKIAVAFTFFKKKTNEIIEKIPGPLSRTLENDLLNDPDKQFNETFTTLI